MDWIRTEWSISKRASTSTEDTSSLKSQRVLRKHSVIKPFYRNLYIAAFDVESPASFLIAIPFPKATEILEVFQHNFEQISDFLSFSKHKLVMLNPVSHDLVSYRE
jgi:hypothetical protein